MVAFICCLYRVCGTLAIYLRISSDMIGDLLWPGMRFRVWPRTGGSGAGYPISV